MFNIYINLFIESDLQPQPTDFFNTQTRKRARNTTITDITIEDIIYNKILNFIISNNLSFNILDSESFQDLIGFFKPYVYIILHFNIHLLIYKQ
jgi:hypothetical protein